MSNRIGFPLLAAVLLALFAGPAWAEKRVALLIGNGDYQSFKPLANPPNDSEDIAAQLQILGFEVVEETNLGREEMRAAIDRFAERAAAADVSVLYYAGHGIQVAARNYLVPVDAVLESEEAVHTQTIDLETVFDSLRDGAGAKIVFLDACRDNPLADEAEGLAPPVLPPEFLVAYSAAPGQVAFDGGGRNSPFASAILEYLPAPGQTVSDMLMSTRRDVMLTTGTNQLPTDWSTLSKRVVLAPGEAEAFSAETQLWQLAAGGPDRDLLQVYLERFPGGPHHSDVRSLLSEIEAKPELATAAVPADQNEDAFEETVWNLARSERLQPLVEMYLQRFPDGKHKAEAEALLATLAPADQEPPDLQCKRFATHPNDATASIGGVPAIEIGRDRERRVAACRAAVSAFPENPHYLALLARAIAAGRPKGEPIPAEAVQLYEQAAERGDARAMISLSLLKQAGNGVPEDVKGAHQLLEEASRRGHPDGHIELAYMHLTGGSGKKDTKRAIELYRQAVEAGSGMAAFNLGAVFSENAGEGPKAAYEQFMRAIDLGFPRAHLAAATLLDEGRGVSQDSEAAADQLLKGVASDSGEAFEAIYKNSTSWRRETIRAVQARLQAAGYYSGTIDGKSGPRFAAALNQWRVFGPPSS